MALDIGENQRQFNAMRVSGQKDAQRFEKILTLKLA